MLLKKKHVSYRDAFNSFFFVWALILFLEDLFAGGKAASQPAIPPFKPVHAFLEEQLLGLANAIR
jgi:hypothetical protein